MAWLVSVASQIDGTTVVLLIVLFLLSVAVVKSWTVLPKNIPPFPEASYYPIVGHLPQLKDDPRGTIAKWTKEKGEMFSMWFGNKYTVFLNSYDVIKEALEEHADVFSDRPENILFKYKGIKENLGFVASSGRAIKVQRTVTQRIFRQFGVGKNLMAQNILEEVKCYLDELSSFKNKPREIRTLTSNSISNNICSILLGRRFDYDDANFSTLLKLLDELFHHCAKANPLTFHPLVKYLPGDIFGTKKIMDTDARILDQIIRFHIEKAKSMADAADEADSYILAYLREMKAKAAEGQGAYMNDLQLLYNVYHLFVAGTETTSATLLWFMLYMLHYPDLQEKISKEVVDVVGVNRFPDMGDKENLNLLNATIMETQRVVSVVPLNLPHMTNSDITLRGYFIPKGTDIIPQLDAVLRDEKIWKDPMTFKPERFQNNDGGLHIPEQFIPFSIGRRNCVGKSLAEMELFLYLSSILQRFELKPADPDHLPPLEDEFGPSCPPKPFLIQFVERNTF